MVSNVERVIANEQSNYGKTTSLGFVNTQNYREAARYFEKYGKYDCGIKGTLEYERYWQREHDRVKNGYSVGGEPITGLNYLYLNYCQIMKVPEKYQNYSEDEIKAKKVERTSGFADFWDEDYVIFKSWDIAQNGISLEDYHKIPIHIPLELDEDNLSGGKHHLWLKPRGVGASYKGAVIPTYQQFFVKDSRTFIVANNKDYLLGDGIYMKYLDNKNFINQNAGGFQRNFSLEGTGDMLYRCSYWERDPETGLQIEKGKKSNVQGLVLAGNANKARGGRGVYVYEEFGSNPIADIAWEQTLSAVDNDGAVFGFIVGFGTGGDDKGGIGALTRMFYDPNAYKILRYKNIWDEGYGLNACCYFTPAYRSTNHKDKDGNSLEARGKKYFDSIRETKKNAKDPTVLPRHQAEKPYNPKEALRRVGRNIFCVEELENHLKYLEATNIDRDLVKVGRLNAINHTTVEFIIDSKLHPCDDYPITEQTNKKGAVCILHKPFRYPNGQVPPNLYRISVDGYTHDESTGKSIGSIIVIENSNPFTQYKGDKEVAWCHCRPETQDDFNQILFDFAIFYNAKISFENDQPAGIVGFAKANRPKGFPYMSYLAEEFKLDYDDKLATSNGKVNRKFGMHMGSGSLDPRKMAGDLYIKEWLLRMRWNGQRNYETLMDRGLIKELIAHDGEKNVDRLSALRVSMYHEREFIFNNSRVGRTEVDNFFQRRLFV